MVGTFLHVFGLMMASLASKYYQFLLAQGLCSPIGASLLFYAAVSSVSTWFHNRRALALGIVAAGSSIGGVIFPIMIYRLLPMVGFAWSMRIAAFTILFMSLIATFTVTSRLVPVKRPWTIKEYSEPLREPAFLMLTAGSFMYFLGMFLPLTFIIPHARQVVHMSEYLASYILAILNAASLFGRIFPGWVGDKIGRFNVTVVMSTFTGIIVLALWVPARGNAAEIVFAALYGFASGTFVSMVPALVAQISPDIRKIGVRSGTMFAILSFALLIGNPIGGALVSKLHGNFTGLQVFGGAVQMVGAVGMLACRVYLGGWKLGVKV